MDPQAFDWRLGATTGSSALQFSYKTTLDRHEVALPNTSNTEFGLLSFSLHVRFGRPLHPQTFLDAES